MPGRHKSSRARNWRYPQCRAKLNAFVAHLDLIRAHFAALAQVIPTLPEQFEQAAKVAGGQIEQRSFRRALFLLALFVGLGFGVEWLFWRATTRFQARIESAHARHGATTLAVGKADIRVALFPLNRHCRFDEVFGATIERRSAMRFLAALAFWVMLVPAPTRSEIIYAHPDGYLTTARYLWADEVITNGVPLADAIASAKTVNGSRPLEIRLLRRAETQETSYSVDLGSTGSALRWRGSERNGLIIRGQVDRSGSLPRALTIILGKGIAATDPVRTSRGRPLRGVSNKRPHRQATGTFLITLPANWRR